MSIRSVAPKTEAYNLSTIYGSLLFSNNFNKPIILVGNVLNNFTKDLVRDLLIYY